MGKIGIFDVINEGKEAEVLGNSKGKELVDYADYHARTRALIDAGIEGERVYNPDGSIAKTKTLVTATNKNMMYLNRYKVTDDKEMYVVMGGIGDDDAFDCIQHQYDRVPFTKVPCFIFKRGNHNKLEYKGSTTVTDIDFANNFGGELDEETMKKLIELMRTNKVSNKKSMPI